MVSQCAALILANKEKEDFDKEIEESRKAQNKGKEVMGRDSLGF